MRRADHPADHSAEQVADVIAHDITDEIADEVAATLGLAARLAHQAGAVALTGRRTAADPDDLAETTKSTATDLVTRFDRAAEELIVEEIRRLRPRDAIVGEEGTAQSGTSGWAWVIDPIDGTTNFVYDQPAWGCSIGVQHDGVTVAGAVFVPALDELYTATLDGPARRNDAELSASRLTDASLALVATGFAYRPSRRAEQGAVAGRLLANVRDVRRLGSAAVDLCFVACGRLDAYYERHLNAWDMAAGELIARRAGAITSSIEGGPPQPESLLAAAPGVHAELVALLADAERR